MPITDAALIFINWNSAELLLTACRSLLALPPDGMRYQVIVVDNGSRDDSLARCEAELRPLLATRPELVTRLEVLALGANRGFAAAANRGLAAATAPYALILNTDIEFNNAAPRLLTSALAADERAVLAAPRLLRPDGSDQAAAVPLPSFASELLNRSLVNRRFRRGLHTTDAAGNPAPPVAVPAIVGPCMAVHRGRLAPIGPLDERFFFFCEETDWCRRINAAGGHVLWVPAARVVHAQGASANTRPYRARVQFYRGRYQYFAKHYGVAGAVALGLGLFARLSLGVVFGGLATLCTLGCAAKLRDRLAVNAVLWLWHLALCMPRWGFEPGKARKGREGT